MQIVAEALPSPFGPETLPQVSSVDDVVRFALLPNADFLLTVKAIQLLLIQTTNRIGNDEETVKRQIKRDVCYILRGALEAHRSEQTSRSLEQYTFVVMCVFSSPALKRNDKKNLPLDSIKILNAAMGKAKLSLVELLASLPNSGNSDTVSLNEVTHGLDFGVTLRLISKLHREIRTVFLKKWPRPGVIPPSIDALNKSIPLFWNFAESHLHHAFTLLKQMGKNTSDFEPLWICLFEKSVAASHRFDHSYFEGLMAYGTRIQQLGLLFLIVGAIFRSSPEHSVLILELVGLMKGVDVDAAQDDTDGGTWKVSPSDAMDIYNTFVALTKKERAKKKSRRSIINCNSKTLLRVAKKVLSTRSALEGGGENIPRAFDSAVDKCFELVILLELVQQKQWHSAAEYCEPGRDGSERKHLVRVFTMIREAYTLEKHSLTHGPVPAELTPLLKDAVNEAIIESKRLAAEKSLHITLQEHQIKWVGDEISMAQMLTELEGARIVGIDLEWRDPAPISILQIAISDSAFLLDMSAFATSDSERLKKKLEDFFVGMLMNEGVTKCFFGTEDFVRLQSYFPSLTKSSFMGVLDFASAPHRERTSVGHSVKGHTVNDIIHALLPEKVAHYLEDCKKAEDRAQDVASMRAPPHHAQRGRKRAKLKLPSWQISLTDVCEAVFGSPLNKTEQCSNWERRPLRPSQILYAANDAHILVRLCQEALRIIESDHSKCST
jgi:hypothetical protein